MLHTLKQGTLWSLLIAGALGVADVLSGFAQPHRYSSDSLFLESMFIAIVMGFTGYTLFGRKEGKL